MNLLELETDFGRRITYGAATDLVEFTLVGVFGACKLDTLSNLSSTMRHCKSVALCAYMIVYIQSPHCSCHST